MWLDAHFASRLTAKCAGNYVVETASTTCMFMTPSDFPASNNRAMVHSKELRLQSSLPGSAFTNYSLTISSSG